MKEVNKICKLCNDEYSYVMNSRYFITEDMNMSESHEYCFSCFEIHKKAHRLYLDAIKDIKKVREFDFIEIIDDRENVIEKITKFKKNNILNLSRVNINGLTTFYDTEKCYTYIYNYNFDILGIKISYKIKENIIDSIHKIYKDRMNQDCIYLDFLRNPISNALDEINKFKEKCK